MDPEPKVLINHARALERALNNADARIKRLEEAGDAMLNAENDDEEYKAILQSNKYKNNKR
jgi:hypothetical protein